MNNSDFLAQFVNDFAAALRAADSEAQHSKWGLGIGPFEEPEAIRLVMPKLLSLDPKRYAGAIWTGPELRYPNSKKFADIKIPQPGLPGWVFEAKLFRPLGDEGDPQPKWVSTLLCPYVGPQFQGVLPDCVKLAGSGFPQDKALLLFAYFTDQCPFEPVLAAFELLARSVLPGEGLHLSEARRCEVTGLRHPHHPKAEIVAWQIKSLCQS